MTNDEAIANINMIRVAFVDPVTKEQRKLIDDTLDTAIKALEQQPCDDAISREELLKAIDTWDKFGYTETGCFVREPKGDYVPYIHYDDVIKCIKALPPVTPQHKYGHWVWNFDKGYCKCSECGIGMGHKEFDYCPNCGSKMEANK